MAQRSLDEVIQYYQMAGQQVQSPIALPPGMTAPSQIQLPPYIIPNAYQRSLSPGASRTYEQYGQTTAANLPPMSGTMPTSMGAGLAQRPMFTDQRDAQMRRMLSGLAITPQEQAGRWVSEAGSQWGGYVGAGAGFIAGRGSPAAAMTGQFFGSMAGNMLNDIPIVGGLARGASQMMWGGALDQLTASNRLRQQTYGGMGGLQGSQGSGMGLSATGGLELVQQLGQMQVPGMNRQDLMNLTGAMSQTGMLVGKGNLAQVIESVKQMSGVVAEFAKLTGDPNFANNLREIQNFRGMGLDSGQAIQAMRDIRSYSRMSPGGAQAVSGGYQAGAGLWGQMGMLPSTGGAMGAFAAGIAPAAAQGMSPLQLGLQGGVEGVGKNLLEQLTTFSQSISPLMLPYVVEKGPNGLGINAKRAEDIRSGRVSALQAAALGPGMLMRQGINMPQMLMHAPELQAQLQQKFGPIGTATAILNQTRGLQATMPGMFSDTKTGMEAIAEMMLGPGQGVKFMQAIANPETQNVLARKLKNDQERVREESRRSLAENMRLLEPTPWYQQDYDPGAGRSYMRGQGRRGGAHGSGGVSYSTNANALGFDPGAGRQERKAYEVALEQQRREEEVTGIKRLSFPPGMTGTDQEIAQVRKLLGGGSSGDAERFRQSFTYQPSLSARLRSAGGTEENLSAARLLETDEWLSSPKLDIQQYTGLLSSIGGPRAIEERVSGGRGTSRATKVLGEMRGTSAADFSKYRENLTKRLTDRFGDKEKHVSFSALRSAAEKYAHDRGKRGIIMHDLRRALASALVGQGMEGGEAVAWVGENKDFFDRIALKWIDDAAVNDPKIRQAILQTEEAGGAADKALTVDTVQKSVDERTREANKALNAAGLTAGSDPTLLEEAGLSALVSEPDAETRGLAVALASAGSASADIPGARENINRLRSEYADNPKLAEAEKIAAKFTASQKARLSQFAKTASSGISKLGEDVHRGVQDPTVPVWGGLHQRGEGLLYRGARVQEGVEEVAGGAAGTTPVQKEALAAISEQQKMLEDIKSAVITFQDGATKLKNWANGEIDRTELGKVPSDPSSPIASFLTILGYPPHK